MLNTRSLTYTGAATLLDQKLQKWNMQLAGVEEVRWLGSGEITSVILHSSGQGGRTTDTRGYIGCLQEGDVGMCLMDSSQRTPVVCKV